MFHMKQKKYYHVSRETNLFIISMSNPIILSLANQKGGVGKTTTTINLATALSSIGNKVLIIDLDPQGNASTGLAVQKNDQRSLYSSMFRNVDINSIIKETIIPNMHIISSSMDLAGAEVEMVGLDKREYILKEILAKIKLNYSYILIDCPPSLGLLTINSLVAADGVISPIQCEFYALEGISQLMKTIQAVKSQFNNSLSIDGIILTMFDKRNNLSHQVEKDVRGFFKNKVFKTVIPRNVRISEAPSYGEPILTYDVNCVGSQAYINLAKEFFIISDKYNKTNKTRGAV